MSQYRYSELKNGYANLWKKAKLVPAIATTTRRVAVALTSPNDLKRYRAVAKASLVPAGLIAAINYRETGGRFDRYLGNGDPLHRPTTHVPAGRGPFSSWEAGATDALALQPKPPDGVWTIEYALWWAEQFNGWGYMQRGENDPYLWSGTNLQQPGMFTRDHQYDPVKLDMRPGVAAIFIAFKSVYSSLMLPSFTPAAETTRMPTEQVPASNPFPAIIHGLDLIKNTLPMFSMLIPQPFGTILRIGVPAVEDLIKFVDQAHVQGVAQGDVADLLEQIAHHLETIANHLKQPTATTPTTSP